MRAYLSYGFSAKQPHKKLRVMLQRLVSELQAHQGSREALARYPAPGEDP